MQTLNPDRSTSTLFGTIETLREDVRRLVHDEVALLKKELSAKTAQLGKHAALLAAGGILGYTALLLLLLSLAFLASLGFQALNLSTGSALFLGFLTLAFFCAIVGGTLVLVSIRAFSKSSLAPQQTMETLREIRSIKSSSLAGRTSPPDLPSTDPRSTAEVRSDVEQTRRRIHEGVSSLRRRLTFARIAVGALGHLRHRPGRSAGIGLAGVLAWSLIRLLGRRRVRV